MIDGLSVIPDSKEVVDALNQCGLTDYAIAKKLNVNRSAICKWRSGDNKPTPQAWGLFLLATGQHPNYRILPNDQS
jgi:DNA-binding transcriptional regulator YiaG